MPINTDPSLKWEEKPKPDFGVTPSILALQARIEEREALARHYEEAPPGSGPLLVCIGNKAFFNLK